ncbi:MAG: ATP-binding protein [Desulfovibrionaceae bacterium]|nr:ATP-binding protein [Desulfovibrionaceae bacterium]
MDKKNVGPALEQGLKRENARLKERLSAMKRSLIEAKSRISGMEQPKSEAEIVEHIWRILDEMPLPCTLRNVRGALIRCNRAMLDLLGLDNAGEFLENPQNFASKFQPCGQSSTDKAAAMIRKALRSGYAEFDWEHCDVNGVRIPTWVILSSIVWGKQTMLFAYIHDLRPIKVSADRAWAVEQYSRAMLNAMPLACLFLEDGEIVECNQEALRQFKASSKRAFFKNFFSECMPETQPDGVNSREGVLRFVHETMDKGHLEREWMHRTMDGQLYPSEVSLVRVRWQDGFRVVVYVRNLAEIKNKERQLQEVNRRAQELEVQAKAAELLSKGKSEFLAKMSHEIRTPLNAIIGYCEVAMQRDMPPETLDSLDKIYSAGRTLLSMVNDILDISKIESGSFEMVETEYDVSSMINDTININMVRIGTKPVVFNLEVDERLPRRLFGDELRIKQVLNNLLSNAFKFTKAGSVTLEIRLDQGQADEENAIRPGSAILVRFVVRDTGRGILKKDLEKIFSPYSQVDVYANRMIEGTGLGLAICRNLSAMMGGTLSVESEHGQGSAFTFVLPQLVRDAEAIGQDTAAALSHFRLGASRNRRRKFKKILMPYARALVVDDLETNLDVVKGLLAPYKIAVDTALGGQEAIDLIRSAPGRYQLVFMDHRMPGMDGVEAVRIIRDEIGGDYASNVPIVALTANALIGDRDMFLQNGFQAFLAKPIDSFKLDEVLNVWARDAEQEEKLLKDKNMKLEVEDSAYESLGAPFNLAGMHVNGLDLGKGMERFDGDERLYLHLLRSYIVNTSEIMKKLGQVRRESIAEYAMAVHALKGSSYSLCAFEVGFMAEHLEKAANKGDWAYISAHNAYFLDKLGKLLGEMEALCHYRESEPAKDDRPRRSEPDPDLLEKILSASRKYDYEAMENILVQMERYSYDQRDDLVLWLRKQTDDLEYEKISEYLETLQDTADLEKR